MTYGGHAWIGFRRSILTAMGLLATACGPKVGESDEGDGSASGSSAEGTESGSASESTADSGSDTSQPTTDDGSTTEMPPLVDCEDPQQILQRNVDASVPTGFVLCASGVIHRVEPVECLAPVPTGTACSVTGTGCESDADCTDRPYGACLEEDFGEVYCGCSYGCASDADCGEGMICACGGDATGYPGSSRCIPADCTTDEACGTSLCALASGDDGCGVSYRTACLTENDGCTVDADCEDYVDCFPQAEGDWQCESFCCCGRPFIVQGRTRAAAVLERRDWCDDGTQPRVAELDAPTRAYLADHWSRAAQMEHASVASFARFSLQLMALGAPPELLVETQQAMADEIDHARRCFALASAYAGRPLGPAELDVTGADLGHDLREVLESVVREACVGETLAAIEAQEALAHATDPAVRVTLTRIAKDELRHAQLGWRTLRWALGRAHASIRDHVLGVFADAMTRAANEIQASFPDLGNRRSPTLAHGVLPAALRREAIEGGLDAVILPCLRALLAADRSQSALRLA